MVCIYDDPVALLGKEGNEEFSDKKANCKESNDAVLCFIVRYVEGTEPKCPVNTRKHSLQNV